MSTAECILPLTQTQHGILFHCLLHPGESSYLVQATYEIRGPLDANRLRRTVRHMMRRHQVLRATFHWRQLSQPVQVVHREPEPDWREVDLDGLPPVEARRREDSFLEEDRASSLEFEHKPPARWTLVRRSATSFLLVFTHHHLVLDGWSLAVVMRDLARAYADDAPAAAGTSDFDSFLEWRRCRNVARERDFWRAHLAELWSYTEIPLGRLETDDQGSRGHVTTLLDEELTDHLRALARAAGVSPAAVFHAAWSLLLSRYGAGRDVVSGAVMAGRPEGLPGIEDMVGVFINTVPLPVTVLDEETVSAFVRAVNSRLAEVRPMQFASLAEVQEFAGLPAGAELFDSVVVHEAYPVDAPLWTGITVDEAEIVEYPHYPLTLVLRPGSAYQIVLRHDGRRFTRSVAERILEHLTNVLSAMTRKPQGLVGEIDILSPHERQVVLATWDRTGGNRTAEKHPVRCAPDLIAERITTSPESTAVIHGEVSVSYRELGIAAARIAAVLNASGVGPGDIVGVHLRHSTDLLASLLAVWRLGAAYLPLDPAQPGERLRHMIADAGVKVVIAATSTPWPADANLWVVDAYTADTDVPLPARQETDPGSVAYVIYTSGTTGLPNGAVIDHRALANYLAWSVDLYCGRGTGAILHSSIGFDLTVTTLFAPLIAGEPVIVADSPDELIRVLSTTRGLSFVKLTPSHMEMLAQVPGAHVAASAAAVWVIGGEALDYGHLNAWLKAAPLSEFVNEYGPTEATVGCCVAWASRDVAEGPVPIGQAIANTRLYILDDRQRPLPLGVPGELYIAGSCVARGYLGRPELTKAKFLPDPWRPGERMYRTADLVCGDAAGVLYYLGRGDDQVKIRGHRVELGEIESELRTSGVGHCKVVVRNDPEGTPRLVAYLVPGEGQSDTRTRWSDVLRGRLPDYMIPDHFVVLDRLPLTGNEKVDTTSLPDPKWRCSKAMSDPPLEGTEQQLATLWAAVLRTERVGRDDDFFELGGHSLTGTRLTAEIEARFQVRMPLSALFDLRTVARLSTWIDSALSGVAPAPITIGASRRQRSARS